MSDNTELPWTLSAFLRLLTWHARFSIRTFHFAVKIVVAVLRLNIRVAGWSRRRSERRIISTGSALNAWSDALLQRTKLPDLSREDWEKIRSEHREFRTQSVAFMRSYDEYRQDRFAVRLKPRIEGVEQWVIEACDRRKRRLQELIDIVQGSDRDALPWALTAWVFWPSTHKDNALGDLLQRYHRKKARKGAVAANSYLRREVIDAVCKRCGRWLLVAKLIEFVGRHFRD